MTSGRMHPTLQWVHGPITVVMACDAGIADSTGQMLQWVHGPITVVMDVRVCAGTVTALELQWVHGPITVVMADAELSA